MFTLSSALNTARNAIAAHQAGVQVASQNVSNAQTEGYSRQRVSLSAGLPVRTVLGASSSGVMVEDISRIRDVFLDQSYRRDASKAASYGLRRDLMQLVEGVFNEPSDSGVGATLDAFWASWADLANDPTSSPARSMIRQRGGQVTSILNHAAGQLTTQRNDARTRLTTAVQEINQITGRIAELNDQIVALEAGGQTASSLRDSRDLALDSLSKLASIRTSERPDGSISVILENATVVDGGSARSLSIGSSGPNVTVETPSGAALSFPGEGSALGEVVQVINTEIPAVQSKLDDLAEALVNEVNAIYALGNGGTAGEFFDSTFTTADSISISSAVLASASSIPSGFTTASGDNELALALSGLRSDSTLTVGSSTTSFATFYREMISGIAVSVSSAKNSGEAYEALAAQSELRRQSVSGVSVDEELIRMMQHQQAYAAATRVVSTVDEMLQSLINMV